MTRVLGSAASIAKSAPFVTGMVVLLWAIGLMSGSIAHGPTTSLLLRANLGLPVFRLEGLWYPLASRIWCADLVGYVLTTIVLLAVCVPAERLIGSARTALLFAITLVATTAFGVAILSLCVRYGHPWMSSLHTASATGPSVGAVGVLLAASSRLSPLWRQRIRTSAIVLLATLALYSGQLQDLSRLVAGLIGLACGGLILGAPPVKQEMASSAPHERRLLGGLVVLATAIGPVILWLQGVVDGPAAQLRNLWMSPAPLRLIAQLDCSPSRVGACHTLREYVGTNGVAAEIRMLLPVILALVLAEGLRLGRRAAYLGSQSLHLVLVAFGSAAIATRAAGLPSAQLFSHANGVQMSAMVVVPGGVWLLTYVLRHDFAFRAPRGTYRRAGLVVGAAFVTASVAYVVGVSTLRGEFDRAVAPIDLLRNLPLRFLPPSYVGLWKPVFSPHGEAAWYLTNWTGAAFWLVVLVSLSLSFRCSDAPPFDDEVGTIRRLLAQYGGTTLSHQATWRQSCRWVSSDRRVAIGYRVSAAVAIAVGDPIGDADSQLAAIDEFCRFSALHSWTPCLFSISEEFATIIGARGWSTIPVGEEAVVSLHELDFSGRQWQDVRSAINRARRSEVVATWITLSEAPPAIRAQILAMGRHWRTSSGMPELAFTIGGTAELEEPETRCLAAIDKDGTVHGLLSWMPVYAGGLVAGWTLDLMRRSTGAMKGVTDFLVGSAALTFKDEGAAFVNLSGIPLSRASRPETHSMMDRALQMLGALLDNAFGFRGLSSYKNKFQPVYRPLFLGYLDGAALPRIAFAIGRAYVPTLSLRQAMVVARQMLLGDEDAVRPPCLTRTTSVGRLPDARRWAGEHRIPDDGKVATQPGGIV